MVNLLTLTDVLIWNITVLYSNTGNTRITKGQTFSVYIMNVNEKNIAKTYVLIYM